MNKLGIADAIKSAVYNPNNNNNKIITTTPNTQSIINGNNKNKNRFFSQSPMSTNNKVTFIHSQCIQSPMSPNNQSNEDDDNVSVQSPIPISIHIESNEDDDILSVQSPISVNNESNINSFKNASTNNCNSNNFNGYRDDVECVEESISSNNNDDSIQ